jgi:hypothetical protein
MKKNVKVMLITVVAAACVLIALAGCATTGAAAQVVTPTAASVLTNTAVDPIRQTVIQWSDQTLGQVSAPVWLKTLVRGNSSQFKAEYANLVNAGDIVRYTVVSNPNRNVASTLADVNMAAQLANELKRTVLTRAASSLQEGEFEVINNTATEAKVTLVGNRRVTDFWQLVETEDTRSGTKTTEYVYYIVYAFPVNSWNTMFSYYMRDVFKDMPESPGKQEMRNMYAELEADTRREQEKSEAQFKAEIAAQQAKIDADAQVGIAQPNAQAASSVAASNARAATAASNSQASQAAYKSGEPAAIAAASTTSADSPVISALGTAARILF